jgi:hypothetical protein
MWVVVQGGYRYFKNNFFRALDMSLLAHRLRSLSIAETVATLFPGHEDPRFILLGSTIENISSISHCRHNNMYTMSYYVLKTIFQ